MSRRFRCPRLAPLFEGVFRRLLAWLKPNEGSGIGTPVLWQALAGARYGVA